GERAGLERGVRLSGRVGAARGPCGALQAVIELRAGGRAEIVFLLGEEASPDEAAALIARYRAADLDAVLRSVTERWDDVLGAVQVRTPDRSMDILLNRWLLYQTLSCRVWARSACYQAGGAYGFRDQLQDVMALTGASPQVTREHLLRAAARQFVEGDVQHWWHTPSGRGGRTRRGRLARVVSPCGPRALRAGGRGSRRRAARHRVARAHAGPQDFPRAAWLGRTVVPPRLLRRRDAARIRRELGVPDRFDRPIVGGDLGRRRAGPRDASHGRRGGASRPA